MTDFIIPNEVKYLISFVEYLDNKAIKIVYDNKYNNKETISSFNVENISNSINNVKTKVKILVIALVVQITQQSKLVFLEILSEKLFLMFARIAYVSFVIIRRI
jgi:hypothetical protein